MKPNKRQPKLPRSVGSLTNLLLLFSAALLPGGLAVGQPLTPAAIPERVFAPTSFWYAAIPTNAPLHTNSANFVAEFLRQKKAYYGTVTINTRDYSSPVYVAGSNTPVVRVAESDYQKKAYKDKRLAEQWSAVPIPDYADQANGTDMEMTIYQPSTDTIWEFWKAVKTNCQWQACWGGRLQNASRSDGTWPNRYGTTATSLPFLGGQITAEELQRGEIKHAMGVALVETESWNIYSWPATRSDGWHQKGASNQIPEGLRFRLDPTVDVDALKMHPVGKIVAKAAQKYGFVVWDKAGAISLRAQNYKSYTQIGLEDPYLALFKGTPQYAVLNGFPWDKLQFLPVDYGKPVKSQNKK